MSDGSYRELLKRDGLKPFLWTQFLGAFNDNCYRFVIGLLVSGMAAAAKARYLALALAIFNLPYLLFSGYAGYLADAFSKRTVLIATKSLEIVAMAAAVAALLSHRMEWMLGILFLLATQAAFFSPAKYGVLPEMLPDKDLSRANGLLEMSTFFASVLGPLGAGVLVGLWKGQTWKIGAALVAVAVIGTLTSFRIPRVVPSGAARRFRLNPWVEVGEGIRRLWADRPLFLTTVGISYLWFLGALLQTVLFLFGDEALKTSDLEKGALVACLGIGIGVGSMVAGRLSGDKVELGLVPLGSLGMGVFALAVVGSAPSYGLTLASLLGLGFWGGLFIVPLYAFLQQRSGRQERGLLIGANNFLNTIGLLAAAGVLWVLRERLHVSAAGIILIFGVFTILATAYIVSLVSDFLVRFLLWLLAHTFYRIRVRGQENVPFRGPALLVANHVSYIDGFLVGACVQRFVRFMVNQRHYDMFRWFFRRMKAIPVPEGRRKDVIISIRRARQELIEGHMVCIFAEGAITRTGNLLGFHRGLTKIVEGLNVPVIPVHLGGVWGSIFSFREGRFFWKWPRRIPYPVSVSFGSPFKPPVTPQQVRQAVMELGCAAAEKEIDRRDLLQLRFVRSAKRHWRRLAMADTTGKELTYGKALTASMLLADRLRALQPEEKMVGIMLPASVGGALANIAVLMAGKAPVNLNFTAGREAVAAATEQCRIRTILTSRLLLGRLKFQPSASTVFVEDLLAQCSKARMLLAAAKARLLPTRVLEVLCNPARLDSGDLATVIFSSGSTGRPKGVMLSHKNIGANVNSIDQLFSLEKSDCIAGVLPFFHSFGFTITLWFPLLTGIGAVYHPDPLDGKAVGALVARYKASMLLATPSFCKGYIRTCSREQFAPLRFVIVGAERLPEPIAKAFEEKFGLPMLEGYGCTEMAPVVAVNVCNAQDQTERQIGYKPGTVGHPIPGVAAKVVDLNTGEPLPYNQEGLLLLKGPNRMAGYLGQPEKTQEVIVDGWYVTGDIACIDEDGFIRITDRVSRFSKIGGEMVPHLRIEEALQPLLEDRGCIVVAIPDEQKGERLVVFHTKKDLSPDEVREVLSRAELPKLWIPKRDSIHFIEALPAIGTGKLDLLRLKTLALKFASAATPANSDEAS